jgi:opacity protein-like surface antigen
MTFSKLALIALTTFTPLAASAVDVAPLPGKAPRAVVCDITRCSGFYLYGGLGGAGSNVDILGSGIQGSVFANGMEMIGGGGYQLWNGQFFAALEVGGGYLVPASQAVSPGSRFQGEQLFKGGYGLQNFFNSGSPAPSQGPVAIIQTIQSALVSPYFIVGARERSFGSGFVSGAGAQYTLGNGWTAAAEYLHVNYHGAVDNGAVVNTDNSVRFTVQRHF